ncbi:MAG: hypothetical protein OXU23_06785 [Candidatus Poribacteria bacterium]|nr:hypothetical protein [Candidatus Poribacteria bacterium]
MPVRKWRWIVSSLLLVVLGISGCALLQNPPVVELPSSRLTCEANPNMVDGNLETVGTFQAHGSIRKMYFEEGTTEFAANPKGYQINHDGTLKTETLIKLDKPTYVAYIEIYPGSDIPKLALDFTAEEKSLKWRNSFVAVQDRRHRDVKNQQKVWLPIRQEVLYLRITADGIEDRKGQTRVESDDRRFSYGIVTPLKGAKIREVKIYERM